MTPHPQPPSRRVPTSRDVARRSAALLAAVLVVVGAPLVARALGDEPAPAVSDPEATSAVPAESNRTQRAVRPAVSVPVVGAVIDADPATLEAFASRTSQPEQPVVEPEPAVDPVIVLLADRYEWNERGPRVALLQETLGITTDGSYGHATLQAHRNALEFVGLPTDALPAPVLPPGPDPSKWAALRQCESNGNYAITNPSGKYRGAYQFDRPTWNSVAERHAPHLVGVDPAAASPAEQDAMALALYSERGARPWPHCGRHLS